MRGLVEGLGTPAPLVIQLPAVLQEDDFIQRFVQAFDDSWAPLLSTLDNLDSYVDASVAPADFVDFVADWVGMAIDGSWSVQRRREIVAQAVSLHRRRGTLAGIRDMIALTVDGDVEVEESGATNWSPTANSRLPGDASRSMTVRVVVADVKSVDTNRVSALIDMVKPAHVSHTVEVTTR